MCSPKSEIIKSKTFIFGIKDKNGLRNLSWQSRVKYFFITRPSSEKKVKILCRVDAHVEKRSNSYFTREKIDKNYYEKKPKQILQNKTLRPQNGHSRLDKPNRTRIPNRDRL